MNVQQPDTDQWAIEGFYIYYGPFDDQRIDYERQMVLGSTVRHAVLAQLDASLAYSIRMQSYTAAGTLSQFSNTVVKRTLGKINYQSHTALVAKNFCSSGRGPSPKSFTTLTFLLDSQTTWVRYSKGPLFPLTLTPT